MLRSAKTHLPLLTLTSWMKGASPFASAVPMHCSMEWWKVTDMIFDKIVWRGKPHWSLRSNPTWRARQARLYLQGWQIYIGVLILLLKDSTRCEFSCLTGHLYMDVQLLGQTQRSIVEWIVHKTKILNNYTAKVRKVKGRPPIKLDIKSGIFTEHEEFNWFFILLESKVEKVQTRYSLKRTFDEEKGSISLRKGSFSASVRPEIKQKKQL